MNSKCQKSHKFQRRLNFRTWQHCIDWQTRNCQMCKFAVLGHKWKCSNGNSGAGALHIIRNCAKVFINTVNCTNMEQSFKTWQHRWWTVKCVKTFNVSCKRKCRWYTSHCLQKMVGRYKVINSSSQFQNYNNTATLHRLAVNVSRMSNGMKIWVRAMLKVLEKAG